MGRVDSLSNDAVFCLKTLVQVEGSGEELIFYGKGDNPICYSTARPTLQSTERCRDRRQGLYRPLPSAYLCIGASKRRHASGSPPAAFRPPGRRDDRRYARLTDRTREEEYFRAMALIEKGGSMETLTSTGDS